MWVDYWGGRVFCPPPSQIIGVPAPPPPLAPLFLRLWSYNGVVSSADASFNLSCHIHKPLADDTIFMAPDIKVYTYKGVNSCNAVFTLPTAQQ